MGDTPHVRASSRMQTSGAWVPGVRMGAGAYAVTGYAICRNTTGKQDYRYRRWPAVLRPQ
jgi:hypothetical protein